MVAAGEGNMEPHSVPTDRRREPMASDEFVVIRHLTGQTETRYRFRDIANSTPYGDQLVVTKLS
jgi:hypothetical protein